RGDLVHGPVILLVMLTGGEENRQPHERPPDAGFERLETRGGPSHRTGSRGRRSQVAPIEPGGRLVLTLPLGLTCGDRNAASRDRMKVHSRRARYTQATM